MPLTPRQLEVLDFIVDFVRDHRYAPTLREMADEFDLSRVTVLQHVKALEEKGYLDREPNQARGITVTKQVDVPESSNGTEEMQVRDRSLSTSYRSDEEDRATEATAGHVLPLIGHLSDQASVRLREKPVYFSLDELIPSGEDVFLLEVRSDQLADCGILNGDTLVVDRSRSGSEGDLVVVEYDDEVGIFKRKEERTASELEPLLEGVEDNLNAGAQEIHVKGTVTGVVREYHD